MSGGQNYLPPAMDMAKVGGPQPVVKVCMFENRVRIFASLISSAHRGQCDVCTRN